MRIHLQLMSAGIHADICVGDSTLTKMYGHEELALEYIWSLTLCISLLNLIITVGLLALLYVRVLCYMSYW